MRDSTTITTRSFRLAGRLLCSGMVLALVFGAQASFAESLRHLGPAPRVSPRRVAAVKAKVAQQGGMATHLRQTLVGKATGPANLAAVAAMLLAPEQALAKGLTLGTAGYLAFDAQLDRLATHANSDRAFARAELSRLQGRGGGLRAQLQGVAWRVLESTSRGALAGLSVGTMLSGLGMPGGISDDFAVKAASLTAAGGGVCGLLSGVFGAAKRTVGRKVARGLRGRRFDLLLGRSERALAALLAGEVSEAKRAEKLEALEGQLAKLTGDADALGRLGEGQTRRLEHLARGVGVLSAYGADEAKAGAGDVAAARGEKKRTRAPHRRLMRIGALGLALAFLANQGIVGRIPTESMPSDILAAGARQELAAAMWTVSHDPELQSRLDGPVDALADHLGYLPVVKASAGGDPRMHAAFKAAINFRNVDHVRQEMLSELGKKMDPRWTASVMADVEHFYLAAWMASSGGATLGAPLAGMASASYELGVQRAFQGDLPKGYDVSYQLNQLIKADLPGVAYGAVSAFLAPPVK